IAAGERRRLGGTGTGHRDRGARQRARRGVVRPAPGWQAGRSGRLARGPALKGSDRPTMNQPPRWRSHVCFCRVVALTMIRLPHAILALALVATATGAAAAPPPAQPAVPASAAPAPATTSAPASVAPAPASSSHATATPSLSEIQAFTRAFELVKQAYVDP